MGIRPDDLADMTIPCLLMAVAAEDEREMRSIKATFAAGRGGRL